MVSTMIGVGLAQMDKVKLRKRRVSRVSDTSWYHNPGSVVSCEHTDASQG